jgi:hypothetical protein
MVPFINTTEENLSTPLVWNVAGAGERTTKPAEYSSCRGVSSAPINKESYPKSGLHCHLFLSFLPLCLPCIFNAFFNISQESGNSRMI